MSYMPETETRCCSDTCSRRSTCCRRQCPAGGKHPLADFSAATYYGCSHWLPLGHFKEPGRVKPGPTVHDCPEGLSR